MAIRRVYKVEADINKVNHHGMMDKKVIIELLKKKGLKEDFILFKLEECIRAMADYFEKNISPKGIFLCKGVRDLLELLKKKIF